MSSIHNIAFLVGRIIAGGFFLMNGFNHFAQLNMMTGYAKSKGIPAPALAVGGSGVLLFLGGLSLLLGYHPTIGAALLVIFLLGVSFGMHNFWTVQDQQAKGQVREITISSREQTTTVFSSCREAHPARLWERS